MTTLSEYTRSRPVDPAPADKTLIARRISSMPVLGTPSIDAQGRIVVLSVLYADVDNNTYRSEMLISIDGGVAVPFVCDGTSSGGSPTVSPDGRWVAFSRVPEGGRAPQLFVAGIDTGDCRQVTSTGMGANSGRWSPGSDALAYVTRVDLYGRYSDGAPGVHRYSGLGGFANGFGPTADRPRSIEVTYPFDGRPTIVVAEADEDATDPCWSPDGSRIAYIGADTHADRDLGARNAIRVVDVDTATRTTLVTGDIVKGCPRFDPDGSLLFAAEELHDNGLPYSAASYGVWRTDAETGSSTQRLTDEERYHIGFACQTQQPVVGGFLAGIDRAGATHLIHFDPDGREAHTVIGGRRQVNAFAATTRPDGTRVVAAVVTSPTSAGDLIILDGDLESQLTNFGDELMTSCPVYPPERFVADVDGYPIEGWKVLPPGPGPFGVVMTIKGGPFTQFGYTLQGPAALDDAQVYADAGLATVFINPRGTSGYGQRHGRAATPLAAVTERDLLAALDAAVADDDRLDANRIGVMGGSFGGYMTAWLASQAPERFRAGICERGVYDIDSFAAAGDDGLNTAAALYGDRPTWRAQSPITYADDIRLPLMIMHSEGDGHCPFEQARRLLFELRTRMKPVELVAFSDEDHELSRTGAPVNRIERLAIIVDWWKRFLSVDPASDDGDES